MSTDVLLKRLAQVGTVTDVKGTKARVLFRESGMTSGWMSVLQISGTPVDVKQGGSEDPHTHTASVGTWTPKVNDTVLCIYLPVANSDGFIIGKVV